MREESNKTVLHKGELNNPPPTYLLENQFLKSLAGSFPRSPNQLNRILEADAELITIEKNLILAVTYDAITEELETGLYSDPFLIGWMTVVISLSDLSAVGAKPLGLLLDLRFPVNFSPEKLKIIREGISEACKYHGTYILGGDTNSANCLYTGSTAIGVIRDQRPMMRKGCRPGDLLYASAKMGSGGGFAFSRFLNGKSFPYQPEASVSEGQMLRQYASACIDTSDGFFPAISQLMELNGIGVNMSFPFGALLEEHTSKLAQSAGLPFWFFLAGPHGEFELLFTVAKQKEQSFVKEANATTWNPIKLGAITDDSMFFYSPAKKFMNPFEIANLYTHFPDPQKYLQALFDFHESLQL